MVLVIASQTSPSRLWVPWGPISLLTHHLIPKALARSLAPVVWSKLCAARALLLRYAPHLWVSRLWTVLTYGVLEPLIYIWILCKWTTDKLAQAASYCSITQPNLVVPISPWPHKILPHCPWYEIPMLYMQFLAYGISPIPPGYMNALCLHLSIYIPVPQGLWLNLPTWTSTASGTNCLN